MLKKIKVAIAIQHRAKDALRRIFEDGKYVKIIFK